VIGFEFFYKLKNGPTPLLVTRIEAPVRASKEISEL
jgi:hypothetical protein